MARDFDFDAFLDSQDDAFESEVSSRLTRTPPAEERHVCARCLGSGKYRGIRVNQSDDSCFACGGRGWHKKSYADRMATKAKAAATRVKNIADRRAALTEAHPTLLAAMAPMARWNPFIASLLEQVAERGSLSENQIAAAYRSIEKAALKDAERAAERTAPKPVVDLSPIHALFATAQDNGIKRPKVRLDGMQLSLAPATGKNAGAIYVKDGEAYLGKVQGTQFSASREAPADTAAKLQELASNPLAAAVAYGRKTGSCSCCGRELTDPQSIAAGIGPICASHYGM
jgi:hypothetical protein